MMNQQYRTGSKSIMQKSTKQETKILNNPLFNKSSFERINTGNSTQQTMILYDRPPGITDDDGRTIEKSALNTTFPTETLEIATYLFTPPPHEFSQTSQQQDAIRPTFKTFLDTEQESIDIVNTLLSSDLQIGKKYMMGFLYILKYSGFIPSAWHPHRTFEDFMLELEQQGPQIVMGIWGYLNHENGAKKTVSLPLLSQYTTRPIQQMNSKAYIGQKKLIPAFIVIVGAIKYKNVSYILYRDPIDACSLKNPAPIFAMSYPRFITQICPFSRSPGLEFFLPGGPKKQPWDIKKHRFTYFLPLSKAESDEAKTLSLGDYYYNLNTYESSLLNNSLFELKNTGNSTQQTIVLYDSPYGYIDNDMHIDKPAFNSQAVIYAPVNIIQVLEIAIQLFTPFSQDIATKLQTLTHLTTNNIFRAFPKVKDAHNKIRINVANLNNNASVMRSIMLLLIDILRSSGFIPSIWHPQLKFEGLMQELKQHGPQIAIGSWSYVNHEKRENAIQAIQLPILQSYTNRQIKKLEAAGQKQRIPTFIVIVGAILDASKKEYILYRDPMDACSQTKPAPLFLMPYKRFISQTLSFSTFPDYNNCPNGYENFPWDIKKDRFTFFLPLVKAESDEVKKLSLADYYYKLNTYESYLQTSELMKEVKLTEKH